MRESKIHSELKHPNIVQLYDTVEIDNNSFATILEFCEGPDLYFYLKKNKVINSSTSTHPLTHITREDPPGEGSEDADKADLERAEVHELAEDADHPLRFEAVEHHLP